MKGGEDQFFWVDAICIDQNNIEERGMQVEFMFEVYKQARLVLVWLGEETVHTRLAFDSVRTSVPFDDKFEWNDSFIAIDATFKGGWWSRLWVVQEAAFARQIIVRCGTLELDWEILAQKSDPKQYFGLLSVYFIDAVRFMRSDTHEMVSPAAFRDPVNLLNMYGGQECLDARDVIFALRSLSPTLMCIHPDYSRSTAAIFSSAARAIISEDCSLNILETATRKPTSQLVTGDSEPLPSWVPNWREADYIRMLSQEAIDHKIGCPVEPEMIKTILSSKDPTILILRGAIIDHLSHITTNYRTPTEGKTEEQLALHFIDGNDNSRINEGQRPDNFNLNAIIDDFIQQRGHQVPAFRKMKEIVDKMDSTDLKEYSFIMTATGYKGFVLGEPRIGDTLFEAYGSRLPLVLRQQDEEESRYTFVGCAIIEELWDWEGIGMIQTGKLEETTI